ncbi:MAG TPA: purine-nucleoside phosphorylase, partial [Tissierellales bacterium]|nr:purine-nucleoside phosphorylase [Tissierellales bacterium]
KKISVMGTGMGVPSIGIYSYELIHFYGVKNLIRVGSCGALQGNLKLYDVIIGMGASTNSSYAHQYGLPGTYSATASWDLIYKAVKVAEEKGIPVHVGNILTSDTFYSADTDSIAKWQSMNIMAVEMESFALYCNAAYAGVNALTILTVSDSIVNKEETTPEEREKSFTRMMEIALELA